MHLGKTLILGTMLKKKVDVLMVGTGEYTTGYVGGTASDSDKGAGVVALTMFDLRRRGKVDRVAMCGVNVSSVPKCSNAYFNFGSTNSPMNRATSYHIVGQEVSWY
jgi:hypothetical protein